MAVDIPSVNPRTWILLKLLLAWPWMATLVTSMGLPRSTTLHGGRAMAYKCLGWHLWQEAWQLSRWMPWCQHNQILVHADVKMLHKAHTIGLAT